MSYLDNTLSVNFSRCNFWNVNSRHMFYRPLNDMEGSSLTVSIESQYFTLED